ncbi:response regulator [Nibribacter ruber]|uniref:Response regulator n=1 Tax=Nibribacter ruber TaxID=2698458 RepID=A0A6P1P0I1_9BACT|nr:response regulator [Nibribacter ruber]QHL86863.1 response regulator [Nibribacter ruber]
MERIKCVLVVDDDHSANFITKKIISRVDCTEEVLVALNGAEALSILQERCVAGSTKPCPQLILLDVKMPVMDGFEFLRNYEMLALEESQKPVIIMLSTSTNPKDLQQAQEFHIGEFLNKPLRVSQLEQLLEKYFNLDPTSTLQESN